MSDQNVSTIQEIYGAFGRGDVAAILERVSDAVEFGFNVKESDVPWHATFRGKHEVPRFFEALAGGTQVHAFVPETFVHSGPHVVASIRFEHTMKKSGRRVAEQQLHWWTFGADGKVERLRHYADTAMVLAAFRG
jgi:ketosteroid isomerase-like protein